MNTWSNKNRRKYLKHVNPYLRLDKKKNRKIHGSWITARVKPCGKYWKRYFSKPEVIKQLFKKYPGHIENNLHDYVDEQIDPEDFVDRDP